MIVLNGEPFLSYNLRALYSFAHQIIVVEGASYAASDIATPDGHSTDCTLEILEAFKSQEDPEDKIVIVTAEDEGHPDGFWPGGKNEQSRAYSHRASGDYLWQVDVDEFYTSHCMYSVLEMLSNDPGITAISFKMLTFWGGFNYVTDGWYLRQGANIYHRLFKWDSGYRYVTHRPPTVYDKERRDLRKLKWIDGHESFKRGFQLYHYSLLFPKQVDDKVKYYASGPWGKYSDGIIQWANENFFNTLNRPFQIHNMHTHPSWIKRYCMDHPKQIEQLRKDIVRELIEIECRENKDIEALLTLKTYRLVCWLAESLSPLSASKIFPFRLFSRVLLLIKYDQKTNRLSLSKA